MLDTAQPSLFAGATLVALRDCVVGDPKNLAQFLVAGGLTSLMDMAELCNRLMQPLALTLVAGDLQLLTRLLGVRNAVQPADAAAGCDLEAGLESAGLSCSAEGQRHTAGMHSTVTQIAC